MKTAVIAGVTSQPTLQDPSNNIKPDYYTNKISDILGLLEPWPNILLAHVFMLVAIINLMLTGIIL